MKQPFLKTPCNAFGRSGFSEALATVEDDRSPSFEIVPERSQARSGTIGIAQKRHRTAQ
jgi:hypothetical protein